MSLLSFSAPRFPRQHGYESRLLRSRLPSIHPAERRAWCAVPVAEPELLSTPAGTGLIRSAFGVLGSCPRHHVGRRTARLNQAGHDPHCRQRVGEEQLQASAQIILAQLAIARGRKPVLRTTPVEPKIALRICGGGASTKQVASSPMSRNRCFGSFSKQSRRSKRRPCLNRISDQNRACSSAVRGR